MNFDIAGSRESLNGRLPTIQYSELAHGMVDQLDVYVVDGKFISIKKRISLADGLGKPDIKVIVLPL